MSSLHSTLRRVGSPVAVGLTIAALVAVNAAATPAGAQQAPCAPDQPVLALANPQAGDVLPTGNIVISGEAFVPDVANGGVSRVDLFLGPRNSGGMIIGSGVPVNREFQITADVPNSISGGRDFVAYAYAAANGDEASVSVPVFIGAAPTATPTTSSAAAAPVSTTSSASCVVEAAVAAAPAAAAGAPAAGAAVVGAVASGPVLQLGNPGAGDLLPTGHIVISGTAHDPAATSGSGIDRVEVFLDNRDEGGTFLGGAQPTGPTFNVTADVSNSANGGHTVYVYARSSVTGREAVVAVPVYVGVSPTPTPRPADTA